MAQLPALSHLPVDALGAVGVLVAPAFGPHVPRVPEVQDWHWRLHGVSQQMPLTQLCEVQSVATLHDVPFINCCATHFPLMQYGVLAGQLVCSFNGVQLVKQPVPAALHAKPPAHWVGAGAVHVPALQLETAVSIPLEQVCPGHTVPPLPAHPPQFFASVFVSVHVPAQIVIAGGVHPVAQA